MPRQQPATLTHFEDRKWAMTSFTIPLRGRPPPRRRTFGLGSADFIMMVDIEITDLFRTVYGNGGQQGDSSSVTDKLQPRGSFLAEPHGPENKDLSQKG